MVKPTRRSSGDPSRLNRVAARRSCVAFRSEYTRYSSLTRLVSRAPRRSRRSPEFHHGLLDSKGCSEHRDIPPRRPDRTPTDGPLCCWPVRGPPPVAPPGPCPRSPWFPWMAGRTWRAGRPFPDPGSPKRRRANWGRVGGPHRGGEAGRGRSATHAAPGHGPRGPRRSLGHRVSCPPKREHLGSGRTLSAGARGLARGQPRRTRARPPDSRHRGSGTALHPTAAAVGTGPRRLRRLGATAGTGPGSSGKPSRARPRTCAF